MNPLATDLDHVLAYTQDLWEELRGQRVFITGGTGFFGCWLLESFLWVNARLELGASVTVLTRNPESFGKNFPHLSNASSVTLHQGDIRNFDFPKGHFSHIIHAATDVNAAASDPKPLLMFDTIVQGTRRALDFAVHTGARKFLLTSSGAVYGRQPSELTHVSEDYLGGPVTTDPYWAYGESKRAAEMLCTLYAKQHGLEPKIARCFAFVGPYLPLDTHFAIGNFIRDAIRGGPIRVRGDGTPMRSYLYASDLVIWLWTLLFRAPSLRSFNVGSDEDLSIAELAVTVCTALGVRSPIQVSKQAPESGSPLSRYVPATTRAEVELELKNRTPLADAIRRTSDWYHTVNIQ